MTAEPSPDLVALDPDHPGFRDPVYRARRHEIARLARHPAPRPVAYTPAEHEVWRQVHQRLLPLHRDHACAEIRAMRAAFPLDERRIPQLAGVSRRLRRATGFTLRPVTGLVAARAFLEHLGRRQFLCTQYVRHPSRPFYTPEPDVIHELVGHAATLAHPAIAELHRVLGIAAQLADEQEVARIERVYWHTLEFGVVWEDGRPKAFGAGLLSSCGELERLANGAPLRPWDLDVMAETDYDPSDYQPAYFVAPGFERLLADVLSWTRLGRWRTRDRASP